MRDTGKRSQRLGNGVVADPGRACGCSGCRRVLAIVRAGDERLRRESIVPRELDAVELGSPGDDLYARALEDP